RAWPETQRRSGPTIPWRACARGPPEATVPSSPSARDLGALARVVPPVQGEAAQVVRREAVERVLGRARLDLAAEDLRDQEGSVRGHGGRPAEHRTGELLVEDEGHHAEGGAVPDPGADEEGHEQPEE